MNRELGESAVIEILLCAKATNFPGINMNYATCKQRRMTKVSASNMCLALRS